MSDRSPDCFQPVQGSDMRSVRAAIIMVLAFASHPYEAWKAYRKFKKMLPPQ